MLSVCMSNSLGIEEKEELWSKLHESGGDSPQGESVVIEANGLGRLKRACRLKEKKEKGHAG